MFYMFNVFDKYSYKYSFMSKGYEKYIYMYSSRCDLIKCCR